MQSQLVKDEPLKQLVCETYQKVHSSRETARLVSEQNGRCVTQGRVLAIVKEAGIPIRPPCTGDGRGRSIAKGGYVRRFVGRGKHSRADKAGYVLEHILVAEQMLGRPLLSSEVVHHRNGCPRDNRPENLKVVTYEQHKFLHMFLRIRLREVVEEVEKETRVKVHPKLIHLLRGELWEAIHVASVDNCWDILGPAIEGDERASLKCQIAYLRHLLEQEERQQGVGEKV